MKIAHFVSLVLFSLTAASCQSGGEAPQTARIELSEHDHRGMMIIAYAPDSADTFAAVGLDSILVLDWLRAAAGGAGVTLGLEEYSYGTMITAIGPRRNGEGGYWLYLVNGRSVPKAASDCRVSAADTVSFFFDQR